jgi:hypothetical protein
MQGWKHLRSKKEEKGIGECYKSFVVYKMLLELRCISQSPSKSQNFRDSIMVLARKRHGLEIRCTHARIQNLEEQ